jgi:hypothetical protein
LLGYDGRTADDEGRTTSQNDVYDVHDKSPHFLAR